MASRDTGRSDTVLVVGVSGLVGRAAARHFASLPGWQVIGLSRRTPDDLPHVALLSVDLDDGGACRAVVGALEQVTHVIYSAVHELPGLSPGWFDEAAIARNVRMLRNVIESLEHAGAPLRHVSLLQGTKAYGVHAPAADGTAVRLPLRERDPVRSHRNFYFEQEAFLRERQQQASWDLTIFRPTVIYGDATGVNMNPIPVIGAYAALLREDGRPLDFPGLAETPGFAEAVDADILAHALAWAASASEARNETFNITNGDVFLWPCVWRAIADAFGMEPGEHRPMALAEVLPRRADDWAALVRRHGLRASSRLEDFTGANSLVYTDVILGRRGDDLPPLNSTIKLRQAGFDECMDSEDMLVKWFLRLQDAGLLPRSRG